MKKTLIVFLVFGLSATWSFSQSVVRLYDGKAPGSEEWNYKEIEFTSPIMAGKMIRNVVDPALVVYLPEKSVATGTAVVVCPGGGNMWLSYSSEGTDVAEWLIKKGIAAFVLKYRLNKTPESPQDFDKFVQDFFKQLMAAFNRKDSSPLTKSPVPLNTGNRNFAGEDGIRAIEFVRDHCGEYGIDHKKVGIIGFSAGAAVTMYTILNSSSGELPNFAAPIYGGWIGDSKIPSNGPPLFVLCAADDPISSGSPDLFKAWRAAGLPAELHIYSKGGHGFGMSQKGLPVNSWIDRFYEWMKASGY
jgi:acetyl esterase/lipase